MAPITAVQFSDTAQRERWINDKGMKVLQFWSDTHRETPVDVFVIEPFDFNDELKKSSAKLLRGIAVHFVSIPTLISMKEVAGRTQDKLDIHELRMLYPDNARQ